MEFYTKDCPNGTICTQTEMVVFDWNRIFEEINAARQGEAGQGAAGHGRARQGKGFITIY